MNKLEMKQKAVRYYNNNKVPEQLERLLNKMFLENPQDIYGYMAEYFSTLSKPATITKITCEPSLSSSGYKTINATVFCCINGREKRICCLDFMKDVRRVTPKVAPASHRVSEKNGKKDAKGKLGPGKKGQAPAVDDGESVDTPKYTYDIDTILKTMEGTVIPQLIGSNLQMDCIDDILMNCTEQLQITVTNLNSSEIVEKTEPKESAGALETTNGNQSISQNCIEIPGNTNSVPVATESCDQTTTTDAIQAKLEINMMSFFLSLLISLARSEVEQIPFYRSLCQNIQPVVDGEKLKLPVPAISLVTCDQTTSGKLLMFKEVLMLPKPTMDLKKVLNMMVTMLHCFEKELVNKFGPTGALKNGCGVLIPSFDKPEQVFDLVLQVAKNELQVDFEEYFDLILNISAQDLYDEEKKKYEIMTGSLKTAEELLSLYNTWLEAYPIVGFIDHVSNLDENGISPIYQELSYKCFSISSQFSSVDELHEKIEAKHVDGGLYHTEQFFATPSDAITQLKFLKDLNGVLMMTDDWSLSQTTCTVVDLSIALRVNFLRISSPINIGAATLKRYLCIADEIETDNIYFKNGYEFRTKPPHEEDKGDKNCVNDASEEVSGER